jgi:hypothetical protein
MLSPPVYTYFQEKKKDGLRRFAHLIQPMYAKVREGHPSRRQGW